MGHHGDARAPLGSAHCEMMSRESSLIACNHRQDKMIPHGYPQPSLRIVERDKQWDHRSMSTRFLTIADVAEQLQLSAQAVRALIRTGDLPAIQVGARKLWRIEDQALEDYIQRQLASTRAMVAAGWVEDEES